jgi:GNAT superfamily N-acetyltransferase
MSLVLKDAQDRFEHYRSYPNYRVYVAESVGQIIGTFALIFIESIAHGGKPYGVVEDVVVSRDWQGRGIGKMMMNYAMWSAQEFGCYKLMLSSHLRRTEAHAFYESLGFKKHGFSFLVM